MNLDEWDFVVVGAGSAGCSLAYQLARDGKNKVLILEAGGVDRSPYIRVPAGAVQAGSRFNWGYFCEPDPSRHGRRESWSRGKVLGGSSSINGTIYVRGAPSDFDAWAEAIGSGTGHPGWSYADVLPIYEQIERFDLPLESRGRCGPLNVRTVRDVHPLTSAFLDSAQTAGYSLNPDYNGRRQEGVALMQLTQRRGFRVSAADAFLSPIRKLRNVKVMVCSEVERLAFEGRRVKGVHYRQGGEVRLASARNVVLSAGAINTPKLLMLSGIGNARHLAELGIDVMVDAPEVGRNLMEHPLIRMVFRSSIESHNLTNGSLQKIALAAKFGLRGQGPIASVFEAIGFLKTSAEQKNPDIQLHFSPIGFVDRLTSPKPMLDFPSFTILVSKNHPVSTGNVELASKDPGVAPKIAANLLSDLADIETLSRGVRLVRKLVGQPPLSRMVQGEYIPAQAEGAALDDYIRRNTAIAYHPVGTCRMGTDEYAVVSPDLRVVGVENLWVADASIMPRHISGNTAGACMMIGAKLGRELTGNRV